MNRIMPTPGAASGEPDAGGKERAATLATGAALGLLGVAAGAFGAHALRDGVPPRDLEIWRTAAHYQQLHAVVLVGVAALGAERWTRALRVGAVAFTVGILVFSGTLYGIVLGGSRAWGAVTPVGGLSLMVGWAALCAHAVSRFRTSLKTAHAGSMPRT